MLYKHNFSPTNYYIWNNRSIQYKNKLLYNKSWVDNGIILVSQLMKTNGQLFSYEEFIDKFGFAVTPKEYNIIFNAIPRNVLQLLIGSITEINMSITNSIFLGGVDIAKDKCSNKYIRYLLIGITVPPVKVFWSSLYNDIDWKKLWLINQILFKQQDQGSIL